MRLFASFVVLGIMTAAAPAWAQNNTTTQTYTPRTNYVPMYNNGGNAYYNNAGNVPVYNNTASPLPMEQLVAGKNAPSYTSPGTAYTGFSGYTSDPMQNMNASAMTPEQSRYISAQREAMQAEYMTNLQRLQEDLNRQALATQQQKTYGGQYNQYGGQVQQTAPVQRRVVYKEKNNPLVTPPRLFNPDR